MASFIKRAVGWQAQVRIRGHSETRSFPTKGEAQAWATELERKIRAGHATLAGNRIVRDAFDRYKKEVTPKKPSHAWEKNRLKWLGLQDFANVRLDRISSTELAKWRDERLVAVSGSSVNRDFNLLSHVFTVALNEWRWVAENPCARVSRPKENQPRKRRVSTVELARLYLASGRDRETVGTRVVMAFEFCIETAMRGGEALSITAASIIGDTVHLPKTKNGDARDVPLSARAAEILACFPDGFRLRDTQKDAMFRQLRTKAALHDLNFHDSRHEGITRLAKILDVLDLARIVGHRNINQLLLYYHADAPALALKLRQAVVPTTR